MIKNFKFALAFIITSLFMVSSALGAVTISDPVYDTTTASVGDVRTVSVTLTTDSGSATINSFSVSSTPSGLSASSVNTPFTVTTSGTTQSFTLTSSSANSYSFTITAVDSNGVSYSSNAANLEYVNPSSLTMNVLETPLSTVYEGNNTGISVNVINSLSSSQTRNLTLYGNMSNVFVVNASLGSSLATQILSLSAGQTKSVVWNLTIGNFTGDNGIGFAIIRLGGNTQSTVYTLTQGTTTTTSSSTATTAASSAGGGSTATTATTLAPPTVAAGHSVQNAITENPQKSQSDITTLINSDSDIATALSQLLGTSLTDSSKTIASATTAKIQSNMVTNRTIDMDTNANVTTVTLKIKYNGTDTINYLIVKDVVPKSFASSASLITVTAPGAIVNVTNKDPTFIYKYASFSPSSESTITYSTTGQAFTVLGEYQSPILLAGSTQSAVSTTTTTLNQNSTTTTNLKAAGNVNFVFILAVILIVAGIVWYYYQNYGKKPAWQPTLKPLQKK